MEFENLFTAYQTLCNHYADRILFKNQEISFGKTWEKSKTRALFLKNEGYKKGDVIVILAGNSPEWCFTFMATTAIGVIALPLDTNLSPTQYREMAKSAGARAAFVSSPFHDIFHDLPVYKIEDEPAGIQPGELRAEPIVRDDIATLLFTSGTNWQPQNRCADPGQHSACSLGLYKAGRIHPGRCNPRDAAALSRLRVESTFMAPLVTGSSLVFQNSLKGQDIIKALAENPIIDIPGGAADVAGLFDALTSKLRAQSQAKYRLFMFFSQDRTNFPIAGSGFHFTENFSSGSRCLRPSDAFLHQRRCGAQKGIF